MKFSTDRHITDYLKVKKIISSAIRNRKLFFNSRINVLKYLDIGCGPNPSKEFINLDYLWSRDIDVCWDLTKNELPFSTNKFEGVFTEHCFEHIPFESFKAIMKEVYRTLKKGGDLRLIMPDGEIYLDIYQNRKNGGNEKMPFENGYISLMHRINGIFRNHGHLFIYDFETVKIILQEIGFKNITKENYNHGRNNKLLRDSEWRSNESLYVEASK